MSAGDVGPTTPTEREVIDYTPVPFHDGAAVVQLPLHTDNRNVRVVELSDATRSIAVWGAPS